MEAPETPWGTPEAGAEGEGLARLAPPVQQGPLVQPVRARAGLRHLARGLRSLAVPLPPLARPAPLAAASPWTPRPGTPGGSFTRTPTFA